MKLMEVTRNDKKILVASGEPGIKEPIKITFVIEEKDYMTLENVAKEYKWNIYETLTTFCEHANEIVPGFENRR